MRIYLSGPITGTKDAGERFAEAENLLRIEYPDAQIVNPVHVANGYPELKHDEYMIVSFASIDICTHMYQMPGWKMSRGCNQEFGYAFAKRIKIIPPLEAEDVEVEDL